MRIGYLACGSDNTTIRLTGKTHPKRQLMKHLGVKSMPQIYNGVKDVAVLCGYLSRGVWYVIHEVHSWDGRPR